MGRPRRVAAARCQDHPDGHVVSDGVYETRSGRRRRYKCTPPVGEPRRFSVVVTSHGTIARGWSPPPECPNTSPSPPVGVISPSSMRIVVDLPAPFGPTNPATPPSGRSRSISLTARRSPKFLAKPAVRIEAMCLPSQLDLRATRCGGLWHRRCRRACRRAGPGPGGTQDEGQEQQLESDGEAVEGEVGPGLLAGRVVHRDGDVECCHDEVDGAVDTGGQRRGEQDHEDRDRHEREPDDDRQRHQALLRCAGQLAESPLDAVGQLASPVLLSHGDLLGRYVPHGGSSCPRCWTSTPRTLSARADEAGGPPSQVLRATGHARLPLLQLPLQPPSFASTSATIERRQPCPRISRRPVTTSQTSHAARPATPTNSSGEPSAMARFPAPAKMHKLPPATPSSRCHGRVKPLAWVANAAPMKVAPSAGIASAKAAAWICQTSSKAGVGSARPSAASTTAMGVVWKRANTADSVAPAATASRDQSAPAPPRRCTSPCSPVTNNRSSGSFTASRPTETATTPRFSAW